MADPPDLIKDPIPRLIRTIALPASIGFFFNTMYNVVDVYYVGMLSTEMVAALSLTFPIFFIIIAFGIGISQGVTALIANALGNEDSGRATILSIQSFSFAAVFSVILTAAGLAVAPALFGILGAKESYLTNALAYMNIILLGTAFFLIQFNINASLNAKGDTKSYRNVLIGGFVLNLVLDPLFMFGGLGVPAMGIKGVALATVVIQALGCAYMYSAFKKANLCESIFCRHLIPDWKIFKEIMQQGLPASANMLTVAAGVFVITFYISKYGPASVAAFGIATRIEQMVLIPTVGLNIAVLSVTGQNNGAGQFARIREVWIRSLWYGFLLMLGGSALVLLLPHEMMRLFTTDDDVVAVGVQYLQIAALAFFGYVVLFVTTAVLQGLKRPMYAIWIGLTRQIAAPVLVFWLLAVVLGWRLSGIWWGILIITWTTALFTWWYGGRILSQVGQRTG